MNMQEVLKYPLGPQPWSLATPDGAPASTTKVSQLHVLEEQAEPAEQVSALAEDTGWNAHAHAAGSPSRWPQDIQRSG